MKSRLSHLEVSKALAKQSSSGKTCSSGESINPGYFKCLKGEDVITAKVSDHHPIVHDGVLFWNVMMQGKLRNGRMGTSYNNGFGIVETDEHYINRLKKVAEVIAEIIYLYPSIEAISLCEGPIQPLHIDTLIDSFRSHHSMDRFFINSVVKDIFHKPNTEGFPNWGLLMLADKKYHVNDVVCDFMNNGIIFSKLANRFHIWQLTNEKGESKYIGLGHFPFGGDERITEKRKISFYGNLYCNLVSDVISHYADEQFIFCADFNLNPYLISEWKDRAMDMITNNNSILLTTENKSNIMDAVTVDGVLLSKLEKQRYYSSRSNFGLFARLESEDNLAQSSIKNYLIQNRHQRSGLKRKYDEQFDLVLRQ